MRRSRAIRGWSGHGRGRAARSRVNRSGRPLVGQDEGRSPRPPGPPAPRPPGPPGETARLVTTEERNIPVAAQRYMSARVKARTTTIDASCAVSVSRPEAVTRIVEQAARTVR